MRRRSRGQGISAQSARDGRRGQRQSILRLVLEQLGQLLVVLLKEPDGSQCLMVTRILGRARKFTGGEVVLFAGRDLVRLLYFVGCIARVGVRLLPASASLPVPRWVE